jgi:hypothetical protein
LIQGFLVIKLATIFYSMVAKNVFKVQPQATNYFEYCRCCKFDGKIESVPYLQGL